MKPLIAQIRSGSAHRTDDSASTDSLGRGMDIALTLLAFLLIGYLVDRWLGLFPTFTITLVLFAAVGTFIRLKYTYDATMERLEAERREALPAGPSSVAASVEEAA